MKKLTKGFEAINILPIRIEGDMYEIANLRKGGILNQSTILIGQDDKWQHINIGDIGLSYVNLPFVKEVIEREKWGLKYLGFPAAESEKFVPKTLEENIQELHGFYPQFDIEELKGLWAFDGRFGTSVSLYDMKKLLKMLISRNESISKYIQKSKEMTDQIINKNSKMNQNTKNREDQLKAFGLVYIQSEDCYTGHGFTVTGNEIENHDDDQWAELVSYIEEAAEFVHEAGGSQVPPVPPIAPVETPASPSAFEAAIDETAAASFVESHDESDPLNNDMAQAVMEYRRDNQDPEPATPAKKPLSIEAFARLTPERITELEGLKEKQELIVSENPFIAIKDKETLKKAKASKAALLKASTSTEKIETDATKYLNAFKKMLKDFIAPYSKITRDAHDKQAKEITRFEAAELAREEKERQEKIKKVQARTAQLVDFEFNGSVYSVGTFYVLPSQIESATDEEFTALVAQGKAAKVAADLAAQAESEKDKKIREMEEELARLRGAVSPAAASATTAIPSGPATVEEGAAMIDKIIPPAAPTTQTQTAPAPPVPGNVNTNKIANDFKPEAPTATKPNMAKPWVPTGVFAPPAPENDLLNKFDLGHMSQIAADPMNTGFIKCREFYKFGMRDLADRIFSIMDAPTQEGVKKSEEILKICQKSKL